MPKQKTHKGMKKRFKVSSKGKVKHRSAFRGHLLSHKSGKQKRQLRKDGILTSSDAKEVREKLAPGS
jgi:large subunit ribosomal protein L35